MRLPAHFRITLQNILLCAGSGGIGFLAMAPYNLSFILFLSLGAFYSVLMRATPRGAFLYSWIFAFGYFVASLFWVRNALLVEGNPYAWAWPLAVAGLPAILAMFFACAGYLSVKLFDLRTSRGFFGWAACFAVFEWLRGFLFTGFPWNLFGYTWAWNLPLLQILFPLNIYCLTWMTFIWMTLPAFLWLTKQPRRQAVLLAGLCYGLMLACFIFGLVRLHTTPTVYNEAYRLRVVQANVPQSEKWKPEKMWGHFLDHVALSLPALAEQAEAKTPVYIVWPETALSPWVTGNPEAKTMIESALGAYEAPAYLLTGYLRKNESGPGYSNSFVTIDRAGALSNFYDKSHLVPFGEYIPFQKWIPFGPVAKFSGFNQGNGPQTQTTQEGMKFSPVICYEIIFSGHVTDSGRPDVLINVTNDSWYGRSPGPYQHFTQSLFRAIEEGVPVIRSASTGLSGLIDPQGRVIAESRLFEPYAETFFLPRRSIFYVPPWMRTVFFIVFTGISMILGLKSKESAK